MTTDFTPTAGTAARGMLGMPALPVAGFRRRLLAMILDLLVVMMGIRLLSSLLSPVAIAAGEAWPYITGVLFFAYFAIFNGPLGGTPGKLLMRMRVTNPMGGRPGLREGILRTAVLFPILPLTPLAALIVGDSPATYPSYWRQVISTYPFFAILLATVLVIPFNPFKQGLHDFLAGTMVRPVPTDEDGGRVVTFEEMTEMVGSQWPKFHRQPQLSGGITTALIFTLLCFLFHPSRLPETYQQLRMAQAELNTIQGFTRAHISAFPRDKGPYLLNPQYGPFRGDAGEEIVLRGPRDEATSGTIALVVEVIQDGKWTFDPLDPKYLPYAEQLAVDYHSNVLPKAIQLRAASGYPEEEAAARRWSESPLELNFVFLTVVSSTPPVFFYREPVGTLTREFAPMNLELQSTPARQ